MSNHPTMVVMTDLDGTLLDHHSYSFTPALEALALLKQNNIPLILSSSKSAAEMEQIRTDLAIDTPLVVENGSGIIIPASERTKMIQKNIRFGANRDDVLKVLHQLREQYHFLFEGFSDMNLKDLMRETGLKEEQAALAMQRDFTEPMLWLDDGENWNKFCEQLTRHDLIATQGGRFISISSPCDKGQAVKWVREYYGSGSGKSPYIVALGDSANDRTMLEAADQAVLVRSPVNAAPTINSKNIIMTSETGPAGWNESLIKIIQKFHN